MTGAGRTHVVDQAALNNAIEDIEDLLGCATGSLSLLQVVAICRRNKNACTLLDQYEISLQDLVEQAEQ